MTWYSYSLKEKIFEVREASGPTVREAEGFAKAFQDIRKADKEMFFVVTLNQKHQIIDRHLISMGSLTAALVHPREVFKPAILDSAAAVAFVHNHPSGDTTPRPEDRNLTDRLKEAGDILGIRVLDHIIVGDGHFSFSESGIL